MDFSVIVPCLNSEPFLERCLTALFAQSWPRNRYEVILVDNNSRDSSIRIARSFPELIVLEEGIQSSYAARNQGVRRAKGRFLAFTDSDCVVCPTWLEQMASSLTEPGVALVLGDVRFARESFGLKIAADYEAQKTKYVWTNQGGRLCIAYTNNMAVRREVFEQCGPFLQIARGGDVIFASKVAGRYGPESVRYASKSQIHHLEINRVSDWLRKVSTYGRSYVGYQELSRTKPLGFRDRWKVMRKTISENHYSITRAFSLAMLLGLGAVVYEVNRMLQSMRGTPGDRVRGENAS